MTVIRFVQTDHLRLGSALSGLAHCPDWLRRVSAGAVRKSVSNVVEAAIAARSHFLLVSGQLTQNAQDLGAAVTWLAEQAEQLQRHDVRLVLTGFRPSEEPLLRRLNAILCGPDQRVDVVTDGTGGVRFRIQPACAPATNGLASADRQRFLSVQNDSAWRGFVEPAELAHVAVPSRVGVPGFADPVCSSQQTRTSHERLLRLTAGAPQSICPDEPGASGCQIVEADLDRQVLTARFCATDAVRYDREQLQCDSGMTASGLIAAIADRSRAVHTVAGRTVLVDWIIDGHLQADPQHPGTLDESSLLRELRNQLDGGHAGVWPRRIQYGNARIISAASRNSLAVQELLSVIAQRHGRHGGLRVDGSLPDTGRFASSGSETVAGLDLLARVA